MKKIILAVALAISGSWIAPASAQVLSDDSLTGKPAGVQVTTTDTRRAKIPAVVQVDASGTIVTSAPGVAQGSTTSGQTGTLAECATVSGDQAYTVSTTNPLTCTATGRLKVGLSSATNIVPGAQPSTTMTSDLFGCVYRTPVSWTVGWNGAIQCDVNGNLMVSVTALPLPSGAATSAGQTATGASAQTVQGSTAAGATDAGNPIKMGCYSSLAAPTAVTAGQRANVWCDLRGGQMQQLYSLNNATGSDAQSNGNGYRVADSGGNASYQGEVRPYAFNGTSWDRQRGDTNGVQVQGAIANGSAVTGKPVLMGGSDGTSARSIKTASDGTVMTDTRNVTVSGTFGSNVTSAYTLGADVGGLATISTGLPSGTVIEGCRVTVRSIMPNIVAVGALNLTLFNANPTASTFTDNVTAVVPAADLAKVMMVGAASAGAALGAAPAEMWTANTSAAPCARIPVDSSGNLYLAAIAPAGLQFSATTGLQWTFEGTY